MIEPDLLLAIEEAHDPRRVGSKFANQSVLARAGFRVPPFFCAPVELYDRVRGALDIDLEETLSTVVASDIDSIRDASATIRAAFDRARIPEPLLRQIVDRFDAIFGADAIVSVRGSMVGARAEESEDSAEHSFAGMSDTFLYVTRDLLLSRIRRCWSSGFSEECLLYRATNGMDLLSFGTAVGVQKMVFGERSFVAFAVDPRTAAKETVIVAGHGIGEGVVQERVPVDHYRVRGDRVEASCQPKRTKLTFDEEIGHGLREIAVPVPLQSSRCLTDGESMAIARDVARISEIFGAPQDVEGTITGAGERYYLQSRPVQLDHRRLRIWSNANVSESFPGTTTPLTFSFAKTFYRLLNHDYYRRCGIPERVLHDNRDALDRLLGSIDGRIYHCITNFHRTTALHPLIGSFRSDYDTLVAELETAYERPSAPPGDWRSRLSSGLLVTRVVASGVVNFLTLDRRFARFQEWWRGVIEGCRWEGMTSEHPLALEHQYQEVWVGAGNWWGITLINYQFMVLFSALSERMVQAWGLSEERQLLSDLLCGDQQLMGVEIVVSVVRIAERARADPALRDLLERQAAEQVWSSMGSGLLPAWFERDLRTHLQRYGHRGLEELKLEQPNLRDTPWQLIALVQKYVGSSVTVEGLHRAENEARERGERTLRRRLRHAPWKAAILRLCVGQLRKTLRRREQGRYMRSELFGYSKAVFRAIGSILQRRGILDSMEDVFYLKVDEVFGLLDGSDPIRKPRELVALRRRECLADQQVTPRREFSTFDVVATSVVRDAGEPAEGSSGTLQGLGSSGGCVRGRARVLLESSLDQRLSKSDILVARETDPGWLFLMLSVRGIVVERGSMLSHTAITGRKFGIPTVVAVRDATKLIPDGAMIEIDGSTGRVTLLGEEAAPIAPSGSTARAI